MTISCHREQFRWTHLNGRRRRRSNGRASQRCHRLASERKQRPVSRISICRWRTNAPSCPSRGGRWKTAAPSCRSCCPKWQRHNGGRTLSFVGKRLDVNRSVFLSFLEMVATGRFAASPKRTSVPRSLAGRRRNMQQGRQTTENPSAADAFNIKMTVTLFPQRSPEHNWDFSLAASVARCRPENNI